MLNWHATCGSLSCPLSIGMPSILMVPLLPGGALLLAAARPAIPTTNVGTATSAAAHRAISGADHVSFVIGLSSGAEQPAPGGASRAPAGASCQPRYGAAGRTLLMVG